MPNGEYWWNSYGPFDPDPNDHNFPNAGQVVRHYRLLKKWTPAQLGDALDKSARWVQAMEHDNTVPEAISRRRALAAMLNIPAVLLGLAPLEQLLTPQLATPSISKKTSLDKTAVTQYQLSLRLYWELYFTSTAYDSVEDIKLWLRHLRTLASEVSGYQRQQLVELVCQYHQLTAHILRDQRDYSSAMNHANRAVKIAKSLGNNELIASALLRRGFISFDQGDFTTALVDLDTALPFAKYARAPLRGFIYQVAGHYHSHIQQSMADEIQAIKLLDQAGHIIRQGNLEDDQSFVRFNAGWYHTERAEALIAINRPSDALDELDRAERQLGPDQPRRRAHIDIFRAKAYLKQEDFSSAADLAEEAYIVSKAVKSELNIARISEICEQLNRSKHGNSPQVQRLKLMLASR
jgi:tetratricopeptide (TPR) repeat protein